MNQLHVICLRTDNGVTIDAYDDLERTRPETVVTLCQYHETFRIERRSYKRSMITGHIT